MFTSIISWLGQSIAFAYSIFIRFATGSFFGLFISMFTILLVVRMILKPLIGSRGSDRVKRKSSSEGE